MLKLTKISRNVLVILAIVAITSGISKNDHEEDVKLQSLNRRRRDVSICDTQNPEFSYINGQPNISAVPGTSGLTSLLISWDVNQVIYASSCADAFEVEFQQVGGGRLSWSEWSAMVGCAPTRDSLSKEKFSCKRKLDSQHCRTRIRFRIMPHNSRGSLIPGRPSPHEEVVIRCNLGIPISLDINMFSSGRYNKPMSVRERQDQMLVARSRDKILHANERRRKWMIANRKTTTKSTTTTSTTTSSTTTATTKRTTLSPTWTTLRPRTTEEPVHNLDPTFGDSLSYDQFDNYYDYTYYDTLDGNINEKELEPEAKVEVSIPLSCSYSEWAPWSSCTSPCGSGVKSRNRTLTHGSIQYCSYIEQTKSCFGTSCGVTNDRSAKARATLLLGKFSQHDVERGYEVRSNLKNFTKEDNRELYCVKFEIIQASKLCWNEPELVSLQRRQTVCGLCTSKAVQANEIKCRGSGVQGRVTGWRMFLEPHCSGSWKMISQMDECDCQERNIFIFV